MNEPDSFVDWALEELDYTTEWFSIGALTEEIGRTQYTLYKEPDGDRSTEHYRYDAYRAYESNLQNLSDQDLQTWIDIGLNDDDPSMGNAIIYDLAGLPFLTHSQFEKVATVFDTVSFQKHISRRRLFRELEVNPCETTFWKAAERRDINGAHDYLLRHFADQLPNELLEYMQAHGRNKAVRNMAKVRLLRILDSGK